MQDHPENTDNSQYETLLNQLAALSSTLEAAARQMINLSRELRGPDQATGQGADMAISLPDRSIPARVEDSPASLPQIGNQRLRAEIENLHIIIRQKNEELADLKKKAAETAALQANNARLESQLAAEKRHNESLLAENKDIEAKYKDQCQDNENLRKNCDDLKAKYIDQRQKNEALRNDCDELQTKYKEQWREAQRAITELENSQAQLENARCKLDGARHELSDAKNALEDKQIELEAAKDSLEKYQAEFTRIQGQKFKPLADSLAHIPDEIRPMARSYYEIDNLPEFLTQCGHFGRLAQLWQSCRSNIVNGENLAGVERFLSEILKIYNLAFPENPGEETIPEAGSAYDYTTQERVGSNGTRIARVILPGLVQPNGQVAVKALVTLV